MTQIYKDNGEMCPATALEVGPCPVIQIKNSDGKDGYNAVKLGFWKCKKVLKPIKGIVSKLGLEGLKVMREFRVDNVREYQTGTVLKANVFEVGDTVMVRGTMKGRGFAGVTKRYRFKGGDDTHGCRANRIPGSMGGSSDPSRIFKGKRLPGHYGAACHTTKGLEVLLVDPENDMIFVKGAVPGPRKGIVFVTKQG
jgi:large subunit ribosomal protein L3